MFLPAFYIHFIHVLPSSLSYISMISVSILFLFFFFLLLVLQLLHHSFNLLLTLPCALLYFCLLYQFFFPNSSSTHFFILYLYTFFFLSFLFFLVLLYFLLSSHSSLLILPTYSFCFASSTCSYSSPILFFRPVGWGCRIHRLLLCWGEDHPSMSVLDMTLNNLKVRFHWCWGFGECKIPLHCHCSQVHSGPEWLHLIGSYLWVK